MQSFSDFIPTLSEPANRNAYPGFQDFATREVADTIERLKCEKRHRDFRKKTESAVLAVIDSPAVAACVLFHRLADENPRERAHARELIRERIDGMLAEDQREDVMEYSAWVANQLVDPSEPMRHFQAMWLKRLSRNERMQLMAIAAEVTEANGPSDERQQTALKLLRRALGD